MIHNYVLDIAQENRGLLALDGMAATPEICEDLITFRDIGRKYYAAYM